MSVQDDAVTGEAAGLAMGLTELGSNSSSAIEDMVAYAQETQHEKILRGQYNFTRDCKILVLRYGSSLSSNLAEPTYPKFSKLKPKRTTSESNLSPS